MENASGGPLHNSVSRTGAISRFRLIKRHKKRVETNVVICKFLMTVNLVDVYIIRVFKSTPQHLIGHYIKLK